MLLLHSLYHMLLDAKNMTSFGAIFLELLHFENRIVSHCCGSEFYISAVCGSISVILLAIAAKTKKPRVYRPLEVETVMIQPGRARSDGTSIVG